MVDQVAVSRTVHTSKLSTLLTVLASISLAVLRVVGRIRSKLLARKPLTVFTTLQTTSRMCMQRFHLDHALTTRPLQKRRQSLYVAVMLTYFNDFIETCYFKSPISKTMIRFILWYWFSLLL